MTQKEILSHVDHTLLGVDATWDDIKGIIDDGIRYETASVCIPPRFVKQAAEYARGSVKICTVIGFPNGYNSTASKVFETKDAVGNGADEIDMVIPVGAVKSGEFQLVEDEIRAVKAACGGKILKVIIETCLLTDDEKITACKLSEEAGAEFVKTSTGFSTGGATAEDVALMKSVVGDRLQVKASGGIRDYETTMRMIEAGADRIGASASVNIMKTEVL